MINEQLSDEGFSVCVFESQKGKTILSKIEVEEG